MAQILAGTGFGQLFRLPLNIPKPKQKIVKYGIMKKQQIVAIAKTQQCEDSNTFYASSKNVYLASKYDESQSTVFDNKHNSSKIIGIHAHGQDIMAGLDNGSIVCISLGDDDDVWENNQLLAGKFESTISKRYNKIVYDGENSFCMVGKEVLPFLFDCGKDIITWNGKNVPNDELDLRVPIHDTDATFFKSKNSLACAHADSKIRIYDIRTNKQKPSADYHLKLEKVYTKANLTNIRVSPLNENIFYVSNDLGAIYECDIRHQMRVTGKFKGINSTVTDIVAQNDKLFASSLDSYVRVYNLESKELEEKHYMNKPIYSIKILEGSGEEEQDFKEEALSDEEEQQVPQAESKKIKKLRKRNKVNLKYLKPIDWDEVPIDEELLQEKEEDYEEINSKDADSYLDEDNGDVKDEHRSDEERDSDLD